MQDLSTLPTGWKNSLFEVVSVINRLEKKNKRIRMYTRATSSRSFLKLFKVFYTK